MATQTRLKAEGKYIPADWYKTAHGGPDEEFTCEEVVNSLVASGALEVVKDGST